MDEAHIDYLMKLYCATKVVTTLLIADLFYPQVPQPGELGYQCTAIRRIRTQQFCLGRSTLLQNQVSVSQRRGRRHPTIVDQVSTPPIVILVLLVNAN